MYLAVSYISVRLSSRVNCFASSCIRECLNSEIERERHNVCEAVAGETRDTMDRGQACGQVKANTRLLLSEEPIR